MAKYTPKTLDELERILVRECHDRFGFEEALDISLGDIDTRYITNMVGLFNNARRTDFSGIETWDTSNVENMANMFAFAKNFNADISGWDVSKVVDMSNMFWGAENFNQPLDRWDVSNVEEMDFMFSMATKFNQNLDSWNVSRVKKFDKEMFLGSPLEKNPPKWYRN